MGLGGDQICLYFYSQKNSTIKKLMFLIMENISEILLFIDDIVKGIYLCAIKGFSNKKIILKYLILLPEGQ